MIKRELPIEDLLQWHKGKGFNIKEKADNTPFVDVHAGERLFPTAKHTTSSGKVVSSKLSPKSKASGVVSNKKEAMVKVDKASSGIKSQTHMQAAADYIARHGKIDLEDENVVVLNHEDMKERVGAWCESQNVPFVDMGKKRPADARRLIISCPRGTSPEALKCAARELAQEYLGNDSYSYLFAIHYRNKDMPNEPDHPHVHFLIKSVNKDGKRLNLRKEDLRYLRERFAVIAKKYDIDLNATTRAQRGQSQKAKTQERFHQEERNWQNHTESNHPYDKQREAQIDEALNNGEPIKKTKAQEKAKATRLKIIKNAKDYAAVLRKSADVNDQRLAAELERFVEGLLPVETSQEEILRKIKEYRATQKQKGQDIKEKMRQRKSMNKSQTQDEKRAIHRKKKYRFDK